MKPRLEMHIDLLSPALFGIGGATWKEVKAIDN
jgi:hypothetical protein